MVAHKIICMLSTSDNNNACIIDVVSNTSIYQDDLPNSVFLFNIHFTNKKCIIKYIPHFKYHFFYVHQT